MSNKLKKLKKFLDSEELDLEAVISIKENVAESISSREKKLVEYVVGTYVDAKINLKESKKTKDN